MNVLGIQFLRILALSVSVSLDSDRSLDSAEQLLDASLDASFGENCNANEPPTTHENGTDILQEGTFSPFSGSLEDLVNTFDEKITSCFRDYGTDVESLAPVQVRTQEEIMNECQ